MDFIVYIFMLPHLTFVAWGIFIFIYIISRP
nr:MAG TPA: protein of unknown function (DUF4519) [Bacteriophage sp.]